MRVFTCGRQWGDMASCIYEAWEWALVHGHDQLRLELEPVIQPTLFDEYIHVEPDEDRAQKVMASIRGKISERAGALVFYASLSREDALDDIYRFLRLGFREGAKALSMLTDSHVMRLLQIRRNVGNEAHLFREFARFDEVSGGVLVSHIEPKNNVVYLVGRHFADRMPSLHWMIIDDGRGIAVVHAPDSELYMQQLSAQELAILSETEEQADGFRDLWQTFFDTAAVRQRVNPKCQNNHFPLWMRKHAAEFFHTGQKQR